MADTPLPPAATGSICVMVRGLAGGGAQRDAILLANALAERGVATSILTLDAAGPLAALIAPNVGLIDLGGGRKLRLAAALPALRRFYRSHRPRLFLASEASGNVVAAMARLLLPKAERPKLVLREVASPLQARRTDPYLQNRIAYWLAPIFYPTADLVLALTEPVRRDLVDQFRVPAGKVVRLGGNSVLTAADLARWRERPRRPEPGLIAAVGRLSAEKDFATLIDAVAIVRRSVPVRLEIAGEGSERPALEAQVAATGLADVVSFAGFLKDPSVLLRRAALFVSSSRYEGFGNAIVEAMAAGVPVIATDAPYGPREILEDGRWGTLVPVGDANALAAAIVDALTHVGEAPDVAGRAAAFTAEAAAAAFMDLLESPGALSSSA